MKNIYTGFADEDYDLMDDLDDDDAEPFNVQEAANLLAEDERRLEAAKAKVKTPAQETQRQYHLRQIRKDRKQLAEIKELQAWKREHVKRTLATDVAEFFTEAGLSKADAVQYLSSVPEGEMTLDHVMRHIEALKEAKTDGPE